MDKYIEKMKRSFPKLWCASAYKGAARPNTHCVPILSRLKNQAFWTEKATRHGCFEGLIMTGWSRFCHQLALCELFPVSVHALALCLGVVRDCDTQLRGVYSAAERLGLSSIPE